MNKILPKINLCPLKTINLIRKLHILDLNHISTLNQFFQKIKWPLQTKPNLIDLLNNYADQNSITNPNIFLSNSNHTRSKLI